MIADIYVVVLDVSVGVPHHLLGIISPTVEFTAKRFRDAAIPVRHFLEYLKLLL